MSKKNTLNFTVCIPTYYGGQSLVNTVKSIRNSKNVSETFRIIVSVDANPLKKDIRKKLEKLNVEIVDNKVRGGQVVRIKQMVKMSKTKFTILTQDDVLFESDTLKNLINALQEDGTTMVGARIISFPAEVYFEKIVEVGVNMVNKIAEWWNHGDNYLSSSGRCLAFSTSHLKKLDIPDEVINSDAYLYFENKAKGGVFKYCTDALVLNKNPQNFAEHLKQHRKFTISQFELNKYLKNNLSAEYDIPLEIEIQVILYSLVSNPIFTVLYIFLTIYTSFQGKDMYKDAVRFWDTNVSTKST